LDTPLRGKQLVVYPYQILWRTLNFAHNHNPFILRWGRVPPAVVEKGKLDHIEERLRAVEGGGDYAFADMEDLCLVPDVVIPPKSKVLNFDKYKGTTCPKNHLMVYYRKMRAYSKDENC